VLGFHFWLLEPREGIERNGGTARQGALQKSQVTHVSCGS
jgi:hypothetical protein